MDADKAIQYLAEVLSQEIRKKAGCGKLQYTPYGKCDNCTESESCQKLNWIEGV